MRVGRGKILVLGGPTVIGVYALQRLDGAQSADKIRALVPQGQR